MSFIRRGCRCGVRCDFHIAENMKLWQSMQNHFSWNVECLLWCQQKAITPSKKVPHNLTQVMSWKYKCIAAFSAGPRFCGGTFFRCCSFLRFASGQSDALPALSMGSAGCEQWIRVAYNRAEGIATKLGPWLFVWLVCVKRLYSHCVILPMHNNLCVGYQV